MWRQIPIGAAHISFSGHTQMRLATSKTNPQVSPRWPRSLLSSDQHLDKHWPGGAIIKMTLERATPKGNIQNPSMGRKPKMPPTIKPKPQRLRKPVGTRSFPHFSIRYDVLAISFFRRLFPDSLVLGIMRSLSRSSESGMGFEG